jgi:hypothetical protein
VLPIRTLVKFFELIRKGKSPLSLLSLSLLQSTLQIVLDCNLLLVVRRNDVRIDIEKEIMVIIVIID